MAYSIKPLRVFITSFSCLKYFSESVNLHIDATYKLNIYGFPVIVVGYTDNTKRFFCSGIVISSKEDTETYLWIFNNIKEYLRIRGLDFAVKNAVADNAAQISKAVSDFDENLLRTNCWAHIARLIKPVIFKIKNFDLKGPIYSEIRFLQSLTSSELFEKGVELFKRKYAQFSQTQLFLQEFSSKFLETNSNWNESYDVFSPSTNNALERFNYFIKDGYICWNKIGLKEFFEKASEILTNSLKETPNMQTMHYEVDEAQVINCTFTLIKFEINFEYYLFTEKNLNEAEPIIQTFLSEFHFFDAFKDFHSKTVFVTCKKQIRHFKDIYCSCYAFAKSKKCKHVYNFLSQRKLTSLLEFNIVKVKKQREGPNKIKPGTALLREKNDVIDGDAYY